MGPLIPELVCLLDMHEACRSQLQCFLGHVRVKEKNLEAADGPCCALWLGSIVQPAIGPPK